MDARLTLDATDAEAVLDEALGLLGATGREERQELAAELDRLVERYRQDLLLCSLRPKRAEVRLALTDLAGDLDHCRRRVERLMPCPAGLWLPEEDRRVLADLLARRAADARNACERVRPGGGRDRAGDDGPSPKFCLGRDLAILLARRRGLAAVTATIPGLFYDLARLALTAAGEHEPTDGLERVLRDVVEARENWAQKAA